MKPFDKTTARAWRRAWKKRVSRPPRKSRIHGQAEPGAILHVVGFGAFIVIAVLGAYADTPPSAVWGGMGILTFAWIGFFSGVLKNSYSGVAGFLPWFLPMRDGDGWRIVVGSALRGWFAYPFALVLSLGLLLASAQAAWEAYVLAGAAGALYVYLLRDAVVVLERLGWRRVVQAGVSSGGMLIFGMVLAAGIPPLAGWGLLLLDVAAVWLPTSWFFLGVGRLMAGDTLVGVWMVLLTGAAVAVFRWLALRWARAFMLASLSATFSGEAPVVVKRAVESDASAEAQWEAAKSLTRVSAGADGSALDRWTYAFLNGGERRALSLLTSEPGESSRPYWTGLLLVLLAAVLFSAPTLTGRIMPEWIEWFGFVLLFVAFVCVYPFTILAWTGMNTVLDGVRKTTLIAHYPVPLWTALRAVLKVHAMRNLLALPLIMSALAALRYGHTTFDGTVFPVPVHFIFPPVAVLSCSLGFTACSALETVRPASGRFVHNIGVRVVLLLCLLVALLLLLGSFFVVAANGWLTLGVFMALSSAGCMIGCAFAQLRARRDLVFASA
ncbi:MAG: hypothetical protein JJU00_13655 [Opitutales bacterium]|nr:hypothetical protein [Opitutales bacterium]